MIFATAATSAALAAFTLPASAAATAASAHDGEKGAYAITIDGGNAYPESIAAGDHYIYTGSIDDGTVYRGRLGAKTLEPFLPGGQDGRTQVTGMKIDGDRLLIAGAFTGRFFIYTDTGKLVASYTVPDTGTSTLVNDEAVASNGDVYITDSFRSVLYRIPAAEVNAPATGAHRTLQVFHQLPDYVAGQSNGNGIVATPDGRSLIIGYWYSGALYRLTLATGEIRKIDAPALTSADGIARRGNTLYIARSVDNEVATVRLSERRDPGHRRLRAHLPGRRHHHRRGHQRRPATGDQLPDGQLPLRRPTGQPGIHRPGPASALTPTEHVRRTGRTAAAPDSGFEHGGRSVHANRQPVFGAGRAGGGCCVVRAAAAVRDGGLDHYCCRLRARGDGALSDCRWPVAPDRQDHPQGGGRGD